MTYDPEKVGLGGWVWRIQKASQEVWYLTPEIPL